jgi:hypothetical protein
MDIRSAQKLARENKVAYGVAASRSAELCDTSA